jgi:hypothetical protein
MIAPARPTSQLAVVVGVVALVGGLAFLGGLYWITQSCACPAQSPLGAYFAFGAVASSPSAGIYYTVVQPGVGGGTDLPLPPLLSTLNFHVTAQNGSTLTLRLVCVVSSNGTVLGTSSGVVGGWSSHASQPAATCPLNAAPTGSLPPGSNRLVVGQTLVYALSSPAPRGTVFGMTAMDPRPYGTGWGGSVDQTLR